MAKFSDLNEQQRTLVLKSLDMSVDAFKQRAARASIESVKKAFEAEAEEYKAVRGALVVTR